MIFSPPARPRKPKRPKAAAEEAETPVPCRTSGPKCSRPTTSCGDNIAGPTLHGTAIWPRTRRRMPKNANVDTATHRASGRTWPPGGCSLTNIRPEPTATAFKDTWGCEKDLYDFTKPEIVGGSKTNCLPKPARVGRQRAFHADRVEIQFAARLRPRQMSREGTRTATSIKAETYLTTWVCRYRGFDANGNSIGGNNSGLLTQNVEKPPNCTTQKKFHKRSAVTCFGGMVLTRGRCACRAGERWNGRHCRRITSTSSGTSTPRCTGNRPVGTYPNCCPVGTSFSNGACRTGGGGTTTSRCTGDRPVGTFPNCCPTGTFFSNGACRQGGGGTTTSRCTGDRPVGTFPNCCPTGTSFSNGACRQGGGGSNGVQQGGSCSGDRPVGTFPNCCPTGTFFSNGACRQGGGGSNGVQQGGSCSGDRPVGTFPNCCPRGMTFDRGACRRSVGTGGTNGTPGCPANRPIGTPPNCCPTGTFFSNGKCRTGSGGSNGVQQGGSCGGDRPVGTFPNCCPRGMTFDSGACRRPQAAPIPVPGKPTPQPTPTSTPPPPPRCTGGKVIINGRCQCPSNSDEVQGRCFKGPS